MTDMNPDNQTHLVRYKERALIDRLVMCIRLCGSRLPRHGPPSTARIDLDTREKLEQSVVSSDPQQQPSSTGEPEDAPSKAKGGLEGFGDSEYQQDQQTLLTCLLAIFRLFVNISHSGESSPQFRTWCDTFPGLGGSDQYLCAKSTTSLVKVSPDWM